MTWLRHPRPDQHLRLESVPSGIRYITNLECEIRVKGRLDNCIILSEASNNIGFGQAAQRGARAARIELPVDGPRPGDRLAFSVTLQLED